MKTKLICFLTFIPSIFFSTCTNGNKFNLFTVQQDKDLGTQISNYIESSNSNIKVLDSTQYPLSYHHLYSIRNYIISSGKLKHQNDFTWKTRIIINDSIENAFATPGGYVYIYTGLIKFLKSDDELAGVLAHEMAHADQRHTTAMLTKIYGIEILLNIVFGNDNSAIKDISQSLLNLNFSRKAEIDADRLSVVYLCHNNAKYRADGAAEFFKQLMNENKSGISIEFLSTHPSSPHRIDEIYKLAKESGCDTITHKSNHFQEFKKSLP